MAVEIKFDANQRYQVDAINAVVELFEGQEAVEQTTALPGENGAPGALPGFTELVFGNSLALSAEQLRRNLRAVQDGSADADESPPISESLREDIPDGEAPLDFSVEMETGTGKTYVYLRTIAELNRRYGFRKFVIVVPRVAIREGVMTSIELVRDHLRELFDGLQFDSYVYDSNALNRVRQFATASHLQLMIINIDSFTSDANVINRSTDAMNGRAPIEFLRACRPIVVVDEPQNMETETRQAAIASLDPLFKLRYSATHRDLKHLVYRLTPVDAYDLRLVKRIGVRGIVQEHDPNVPEIEVKKVRGGTTGVTASAVIQKETRIGTKPTNITLRKDLDVEQESGGRAVYRGWVVEDIVRPDGSPAYVEFANGRRIEEGSSTDHGGRDQLQRLMIRQAIEAHFERERELDFRARRGVISRTKPLTLFFIDRVANYVPDDAKFRQWFEEEYEAVRADGKHVHLKMPDPAEVHDGYFATDRGVAKDTQEGRDSAAATRAFELIMRDKQKLLSLDEPLRFIFSHSALGEGWDNPNVFVICNLQDGKSEVRKRQQIGRGLRLPVMDNGERCRVDQVNHLTVIANEAFEEFAATLQSEIEEETGVKFDDRIVNEDERVRLDLKDGALESSEFRELWERISPRTTYRLQFDTANLVAEAVRRLKAAEDIEPIRFIVREGRLEMRIESGVKVDQTTDHTAEAVTGVQRVPDILGELSRRVPISRSTIATILRESGRVDDARENPTAFLDLATDAILGALHAQLADSIHYTPIPDDRWEAEQFETHVGYAYDRNLVDASKSITAKLPVDSDVERQFSAALEKRDDVKLYLKLPTWFKVPTPLGGYNPDWAIVREVDEDTILYLVRETKGGDDLESLRFEHEKLKIKFGHRHFEAIKVDYAFGSKAGKLLEPSEAGP
ncbi:MAG: type III restriction endonuclease subunit R [Actinomycetes bacterium]|nr:MAG: type III restriction endonuclease subunit R [Actinomycetes bacterium]